jgi:hypothetical protein
MGTGPFPGVTRPGRGVVHPPHLAPRLRKEELYLYLLPLWALAACYRVKFTFTSTKLHEFLCCGTKTYGNTKILNWKLHKYLRRTFPTQMDTECPLRYTLICWYLVLLFMSTCKQSDAELRKESPFYDSRNSISSWLQKYFLRHQPYQYNKPISSDLIIVFNVTT